MVSTTKYGDNYGVSSKFSHQSNDICNRQPTMAHTPTGLSIQQKMGPKNANFLYSTFAPISVYERVPTTQT